MVINELFDGIAEAFRLYQAEMTEQKQTSTNPVPAGLEPERESEKTEKIMPTEKGVEQYFPNKAFERYFQIESDDLRDIYKDAVRKNEEKGKVINFKK